ncbi:MAG: ZIP family metal transporter [Candidatus Poseidoniia archaeon]|nr:ZIP family metal transporter [Candidatus Poseidoniia archaeon]
MDDQTIILLLSVIMFAGALAFGYIPLGFRFSHRRLEQFMALGAGVLVGSAFLVIIPEGLELTLGTAAGIAPLFLGGAILAGFTLMLLLEFFGLPHAVHHEADRELLSLSATIGLVIHASVDGLALGASVTSSTETGLIVFAAIMLHKGPTAFGLASFLAHIETGKSRSRLYLLLFALTSPLAAILAFYTLRDSVLASDANIGLALLFSAGTFLYVATVDVLPEVHSHDHDGESPTSFIILGMLLVLMVALLGPGY